MSSLRDFSREVFRSEVVIFDSLPPHTERETKIRISDRPLPAFSSGYTLDAIRRPTVRKPRRCVQPPPGSDRFKLLDTNDLRSCCEFDTVQSWEYIRCRRLFLASKNDARSAHLSRGQENQRTARGAVRAWSRRGERRIPDAASSCLGQRLGRRGLRCAAECRPTPVRSYSVRPPACAFDSCHSIPHAARPDRGISRAPVVA
jgi:hypothetical protein